MFKACVFVLRGFKERASKVFPAFGDEEFGAVRFWADLGLGLLLRCLVLWDVRLT